MNPTRCEFTGCKRPAAWECKKLYGDFGTIRTCDEHKPSPDNRPPALRSRFFYYDVSPIAGAK